LSSSAANVKTIAPGAPFLKTLVRSCINGSLGFQFSSDQRDYSNATIYVPTRRAARALAHAFADALQPQAILLPRIIPLGDPADLEERAILAPEAVGLADDVPPAINDLERRLLLTSLVERWRQSESMRALDQSSDGFTIGGGFADSFSLAGELAGLIDEFAVESIDWRKIKDLPHGAYDQYWSITRSFLEIASEAWPAILTAYDQLDPAERLNRLLRNEAMRLKADPPNYPVIAAGSTGTVPATAALLSVIARLPKGVVILPGLDTDMDERGWQLVAEQSAETGKIISEAQPGHPQAALKRLLHHLRMNRADVQTLVEPTVSQSQGLLIRSHIINASARAAEATDDWPEMRKNLEEKMTEGLDGLSMIEAADEREEALAIAVALRETLETPDQTAALITPDRALAQRVAIELMRWGITADDSSGMALSQMPLGSFARLTLAAVADDFKPVAVMSLLSNACYAPAQGEEDWVTTLATFELAGLRGNFLANGLANGLANLATCLDQTEARMGHHRAPPSLVRIDPVALANARLMLEQFIQAMTEMASMRLALQPLADIAACHERLIIGLAGERAETGSDAIALGQIFDSLATTKTNPPISLSDYQGLFETLVAECIVPPSKPVQGRIKIWGLLEARLMEADRVILGGLNEKMWPPDVRTDPFLNRSMRTELGLSSPERRIGQTGHDFAQALGAERVIMTRAMSVEGTPMIASRFLRRFDAFIGDNAAKTLRHSGDYLLRAARALDAAPSVQPIKRPEPRVPAAMHPPSLSVTEISTLYRDPYAIYAKHILKLAPLEPLELQVDARDKGTIFHEALAQFIKEASVDWPAHPLTRLLEIGTIHFNKITHLEQVSAFWWPVFVCVAKWFVDWEVQRREGVAISHVEVFGSITLPLEDGAIFTLRGTADRIDQLVGGGLAILDYKTGSTPTAPQVGSNFEPQLTLMAAMALRDGFKNIPKEEVLSLSYIAVGSNPGVKAIDLLKEFGAIETVATRHIEALQSYLDRLRDGQEGFTSRRRPEKLRDNGDFDHLARVKEWMSGSEEQE
jgi:ATP-dependent helicase/nuclease subunit B